jgi:tetratricopeptide (TPR) repeat protein
MLLRNEINDAVKSEIYYNIGNIYFIYDDYDKALEYYKHSLFLNPKDTDAIYNTELYFKFN